jgi:hypothetical protein
MPALPRVTRQYATRFSRLVHQADGRGRPVLGVIRVCDDGRPCVHSPTSVGVPSSLKRMGEVLGFRSAQGSVQRRVWVFDRRPRSVAALLLRRSWLLTS